MVGLTLKNFSVIDIKFDILAPYHENLRGFCGLRSNSIARHRSCVFKTAGTKEFRTFCAETCKLLPDCLGISIHESIESCYHYSDTCNCAQIHPMPEEITCKEDSKSQVGPITTGYSPGEDGCFVKRNGKHRKGDIVELGYTSYMMIIFLLCIKFKSLLYF